MRVQFQMTSDFFNANSKEARLQYKNHIIYDCEMYDIDDKHFIESGTFTATLNAPDKIHWGTAHPVWSMAEMTDMGIFSYIKKMFL